MGQFVGQKTGKPIKLGEKPAIQRNIFLFGEIKDTIRPDVDLNELTTIILAVMDGLQIQWLLDPEKVNMTSAYRLFSRIVVDFLMQ